MPSYYYYLLLYHLVIPLQVTLEKSSWCSFLPVIGPYFRVSWERVPWTIIGVSYWSLFGASKVLGINNDKNKTLQIKLQF